MLYRYAPDDAPDTVSLRAGGILVARSLGPACRIDLLDGEGTPCALASDRGFIALAVSAPMRARLSLEGGAAWVLASPTAEDLRALSVEDLAAIRDAIGLQSKAKGAAGIAAALGRFLGLE